MQKKIEAISPAVMKGSWRGSGPAISVHAGDLPNITVGPDGVANVQLYDPYATLFGRSNGLWENGGAAIVIHANRDEMTTDPGGNAGDRIACGVIAKPEDYRSSSVYQ